MLEKAIFFAIGFLVARYVILNTPDYRVKETQNIDDVRNKIHYLIKKYAPQADDSAVGADVMATVQ